MLENDLRINLKKGDPAAYRFLFDAYYAGLCSYAFKYTREKASAEEIVHNTFVKLWEKKESIEITDSVVGYLFRSVQNNALNYLKHLQVNNRFNQVYTRYLQEALEYFTISQETGQSILLAREMETEITKAIEALPEQCREIFKLSRLKGLKNAEIAQLKNISLNTVQKQISIALEKLRFSLKKYLILILILAHFFLLS